MTDPANTYDVVPYESVPFVETHPDRLAALAMLHGLDPPPIDRCRVLELGCSHGRNLIPMALTLPDSSFLGIDLSRGQIDEGRQFASTLGLANFELLPLSILDFGEERGTFDYIICHGVYSWVPPEVQDKILDICTRQLSPNGVVYLSYNTYPGWFVPQMIRGAMLFQARQFVDPREQVSQGRAFLADLAAAVVPDPTSTYATTLQGAVVAIREKSDSYMLHEYLEEYNEPLYFQTFIERITPKALRYVCDGRPWSPAEGELSPAGAALLRRCGADPVLREQCFDFLTRRTFRRSLICHAAANPSPPLPEHLKRLHFASAAQSQGIMSPDIETFRAYDGRVWPVADPLLRDVLRHLAGIWPRTCSWDELADPSRDAQKLAGSLLNGFFNTSLLEFRVRPWTGCTTVSERPLASPLVRLQAGTGSRVTNLRHEVVDLPPFLCQVVVHLDGTRDRAALVEALAALVVRGTIAVSLEGKSVTDAGQAAALVRESLTECLAWVARNSLLVG
jgi:SAM-dependent methyltransferase